MEGVSARRTGTAAERQGRDSAHRARLLEVGLELFGTAGYTQTTIGEVCAAAGLNRRYFYEWFADREALLRAVYDEVAIATAQAVVTAVEAAEGPEAKLLEGVSAFWSSITQDRRRARVLTIEVVGVSDDLEDRRRATRRWFAKYLADALQGAADAGGWTLRARPELTARNIIAAHQDMVVDWLREEDLTVERLAEHSVQLCNAMGTALLYDPAQPERRVVIVSEGDADTGLSGMGAG